MGNCYIIDKKLEKKFKLSENVKEKIRRTSFNPQILKNLNIHTNKEILKDYKMLNQIGSGLFSKVYLVLDKKKRKRALKIIKKKILQLQKYLKNF